MKKILMLATAAFLFSGVAFAQEKTEKKCAKGKDCCKKDCKKDAKDAKTTTAKPASKPAPKKA